MGTPIDHINLWRLRALGFQSRFVETSRGRVHVLDGRGRGPADTPPLVLLHGISSRSTHYARVVRTILGRAGRVILPDALGHGLSEIPEGGLSGLMLADTMGEALDQILDAPAIVFGNSMGGFLAAKYANRSPQNVRSLILSSPAGAWMPPERIQPFLDRFRLATHEDALALLDRAFVEPPPLRHLVAWALRRQLNAPRIRQLLDSTGTDDMLSPEELSGLQMPVLFIWGEAEKVLLPEHRDYFLEHLPPHAQRHAPERYGHSCYFDQPDDLADRLIAWSDRLASRGDEPDMEALAGAMR